MCCELSVRRDLAELRVEHDALDADDVELRVDDDGAEGVEDEPIPMYVLWKEYKA